MAMNDTGTGYLRVRTYAAESALPVPGVYIRVLDPQGTILYQGNTDAEGIMEDMTLSCPPRALSLDEDNTQLPYGLYNIEALLENYVPLSVHNFQVFDGETTMAELTMEPDSTDVQAISVEPVPDVTDVPPHHLYAGGSASGPAPLSTCPLPRVLTEVIIPNQITVHLGKPSAVAQNVTISFVDYIKNVASSEIYPTWPEQALRANIYAQISLALNRVYTEWYKSKGYSFQITNSTSYDQYYVHNRTIFEIISRITDEIFNTYIRKTGTVNPFYAEYCDGKIVTSCPGMKQWGTVTQANAGKNALQILRVYYGNDIELITTNNIKAIPESYPGTPLRLGSTGINVKILQRQLNRIAQNYPSFGTQTVDGVFGTATESAVKKFQAQFSLTADGVVGRSTWYKISYIYVAVKKLAELTSEGEKPTGDLVAGVYPGAPLRLGSRGNDVLEMQFWLDVVASFTPEIPRLAADGIFGAGTEASVRAFQRKFGLTVDGIVGQSTWDAIYQEYNSTQSDSNPGVNSPGQFPGTTLAPGSTGDNVRVMQFYLRMVARFNSSIPDLASDGIFGPGTERSVLAFQSFYGLLADGLVGRQTWNKLYEVYTDLINGLLASNARPGTYPGTPLRIGSTGTAVKEMQYYLYLMSAYYSSIPVIAYDGIFGTATDSAVRAYQSIAGLTVDGVVGLATWNSIYAKFEVLREVDGPVAALRVFAYPGYVLSVGMQGDMVAFAQFMLAYVGAFYDAVLPVTALTGVYDEDFAKVVSSFQKLFLLTATGSIDEQTWNTLTLVYLSSAAQGAEGRNVPEGEYGGYVLLLGSTGLQVYRLQTYINGIAARYCVADFIGETGVFDLNMQSVIEQFQAGFGLNVTGIVDKITWDTIYNYYIDITGEG